MSVPTPTETRIALIGVLRCVGICVAIGEMAYLFAWMLLTLPLAAGIQRTEAMNGMLNLGVGMVWAAVFGTVVGLTTTLTFNLVDRRAPVRTRARN